MLIFFTTDILSFEEGKAIGTAVLSLMICVFVKLFSRSAKYKSKVINELNVGPDMIVTAIFLMVTVSTDRYEVLWFIVILLGTALEISFFGWRNKNKLHKFWGVILPNLIGVLALWYVFDRY